jgi:protein arginine kinase activator
VICEICQKQDASVHLKQVVDGAVREMYICQSCAKAGGFQMPPALGLTDLFFGLAAKKEDKPAAGKDRTCPACHMRGSDFQKTSRLGCAACYQIFSDDLAPMIEGMHKGVRHVGKVPKREALEVSSAGLREALSRAVAAQNFEEAARLRDEIRMLKAAPVSPAPGAHP